MRRLSTLLPRLACSSATSGVSDGGGTGGRTGFNQNRNVMTPTSSSLAVFSASSTSGRTANDQRRVPGFRGLSFRFVLVLACSFVLPGCNVAPTTADRATTAVQWQRWEGALTAQKLHSQPYATVEVEVRFSGPDGATLRVPAFWDGDRGFRFRAAFPSAGVWRWRTTCNDATDPGLHGRTGEVRVKLYSGGNPLYQHGDLRISPDRRYLVHADGTPFLWLGDTGWYVAWKSTATEWREYVDTRARQHFSVLQIVAAGIRNNPGNPTSGHPPFQSDGTPNPPYWRELAEKLAYANDRGLVVLLTGVGKSHAGFSEPQRPLAFARELAGRLAGHMIIFSPSMDQKFDAQNAAVGVRLRTLTTHLITQHPGTHFETAKMYHDSDHSDFSGLQTGHHGGNLARAYEAARAWTLELWRRTPLKPVINLEAMYDAYGHDNAPGWREQDVRKLGWITWLSGARGYTYGVGDVPPKVPTGAGGVWRFSTDLAAFDYWRKALAWPSAGQMTHLRDFFAGIDWWRLEPASELVKNQAEAEPRKIVASRSPTWDLVVAYLPDNPEIVLDLTAAPPGLGGRWFNPITGDSVPLKEPIRSGSSVVFSRLAAWSDAVLCLTKPGLAPESSGVGRGDLGLRSVSELAAGPAGAMAPARGSLDSSE